MPHSTRFTHGVVTPHASFLALRYAPHEAIANLRALADGLPIYGPRASMTPWTSRWG